MYCRKCGYEIPDDSVFCQRCGAKVVVPQKTSGSKQELVFKRSFYTKLFVGLGGLVLVLAVASFFGAKWIYTKQAIAKAEKLRKEINEELSYVMRYNTLRRVQ